MECVEVVESLSQKEKNKILSVLKRDESLQRGQEKKIRDLKHEIQMIRTKAVLRAGDDQNKICLRCRQPFGMIFNRGTICSACKTKVCKDCQEFLFNGSWLCKMCYKQRQLKWLTGEWAVSYDENPLRKWASGSDLIRASMQLRPMSTSSIDIDEPSENKPGTPTRKPAQNGVHGAEQGTKPRVDYPREGDQHRLSQLFDVLRTRKPDSEPSPRSHTEIKRVTSRRYSESDSDSSTSSNGDEISARSSPNTALSLTESELDARRNDSPYGGDIPSPRGLGSPESSESSLRLTSPDKSDDSPEKERQGQKPKPSPRASPRASPRSPRPGARQKGQNENSDPDRSPVKLQSEPIDPNKVVRPKARPRSGEKGYSQGQRSSRAITEISEELSENGTSLSPVESDLQLHVSRTRESLDKKQESHMKLSRTSLDSPSKSGSASPSGSMRSLSEQSARRSSDNLSVRSASSDQGRAVNRKSDEFLNVDKVSRSSRQDLNETSVQIRTTRSREAIEILDDTQTSVSPDPDQFNQNETQIADKDRTTSDKPSDKTQTKTSMQITDDESQGFLTAPRSGSPYSFSMESLPSSHPSPTTRRSIGESSLVESSDTDSISRYSHLDINEHSGTESAARDEEEFVVEEISKVRFKTVTKKIAQMNVLAKISKSPNRNDTPGEVRQRATRGRGREGGNEEGGATRGRGREGGYEEGGIFQGGIHRVRGYSGGNGSRKGLGNQNIIPGIGFDKAECAETPAEHGGAHDDVFEISPEETSYLKPGNVYSRQLLKSGVSNMSGNDSRSLKELSWFNEFETSSVVTGKEKSRVKTKAIPRHLTSSVASDKDRVPSEADSIEGMIDEMARPVIYENVKRSTHLSTATTSDSLTPVSPIDFSPVFYEKRNANYKFAFDMSDDNLDSADDVLDNVLDESNDGLEGSNVAEVSVNEQCVDEVKNEKTSEFKKMSSLDSLISENNGDSDIEKEFEEALKLAALRSRDVSDDDDLEENPQNKEAIYDKNIVREIALQDKVTHVETLPSFKAKPPLTATSSLDILLNEQGDNVDITMERVELDELVASIEEQFSNYLQSEVQAEPEINPVKFLDVQVQGSPGTLSLYHNKTSPEADVSNAEFDKVFGMAGDHVDSASKKTGQKESSSEAKSRKSKPLPLGYVALKDSSDSSDSDMLSVIDEEDESVDEMVINQTNNKTSNRNDTTETAAAEVKPILPPTEDVLSSSQSDKGKPEKGRIYKKVQLMEEKAKAKGSLQKSVVKKAIEKKGDVKTQEKYKRLKERWQAIERHEADLLDLDNQDEETSTGEVRVSDNRNELVNSDIASNKVDKNVVAEYKVDSSTVACSSESNIDDDNMVYTASEQHKEDIDTDIDLIVEDMCYKEDKIRCVPHTDFLISKLQAVIGSAENKSIKSFIQKERSNVETGFGTDKRAKEASETLNLKFENTPESSFKEMCSSSGMMSNNLNTSQFNITSNNRSLPCETKAEQESKVKRVSGANTTQDCSDGGQLNVESMDASPLCKTISEDKPDQLTETVGQELGTGDNKVKDSIDSSPLCKSIAEEDRPTNWVPNYNTCTYSKPGIAVQNIDSIMDSSPLYQTIAEKESELTSTDKPIDDMISERNILCQSIAELEPEFTPENMPKVLVEGWVVDMRDKNGNYGQDAVQSNKYLSIRSEVRECKSIAVGEPDDVFYNVASDEDTCKSIDEDEATSHQVINSVKDKKVKKMYPANVSLSIHKGKDDNGETDNKLIPLTRVSNMKGAAPKPEVLPESSPLFKPITNVGGDPQTSSLPLSHPEPDPFKPPVAPPRAKRTPSSVSSSSDKSTSFSSEAMDLSVTEKLGPSRESPQTISECSGSQDDSGHVSGGSRGNTPEHRRTESSYSQSSLPSTLSTVTDRSEEEEDIDKVVAMHNQYAGSRGNLLSVIGDSRESIASYYSDAGDIAVSTVPVSGEILFGLNYNYKTGMLEVAIKQCREIAIADTRRHKTDPYVKSYLLPDKTRSGKRKTKVKKHTTNPVFEETLRYSISKSELENRTLWITVWHNDRFGRNSFLGEVTINFDYYKFGDPTPIWYLLQERVDSTPSSMMVYKGDISMRIRYAPSDRNNSNSPQKGKHKKETAGKGRLEVMVKEARNLTAVRSNGFSDPFCKGYLLPERHKSSKQKTCVIKKNCNPVWNHTFVFDDVSPIELRERCLELTVWDYEKLSSNDFLGGVRLNLGTGVSAGKPVDWMDARGEEMSMWQAMLDRPNLWIDGALILRPNMEKRKF